MASGSPPWPKILNSDGYPRRGRSEIPIVTVSRHPVVTDNRGIGSRFSSQVAISPVTGLKCEVAGYNNFLSGDTSNISVPGSLDTVAVALDVIAIGAVLVLTTLSLILSRGLNGTGLRRGFALTAVAGFVQIIGSSTQFAVDLGFTSSRLPTNIFSGIQVLFLVLLALAVQSFFPVWFKSFKGDNNSSNQPREDPHSPRGSAQPTPS